MATSGTVSTFPFTTRKVMDHAFRRARLMPQMNAPENLSIAQDCLYMLTSEWVNAGFPQWTRQFYLLGPTIGQPDVTCPLGTMEVIHAYWRSSNLLRGVASVTGGADGSALFSGQPGADITIPSPNPAVTVAFGSPTEVDTVGVLLGGSSSITTALQILTSTDGVTYVVAQTLPSATYAPGEWTYFDLDPSVIQPYFRLQYTGGSSWVLNQLNLGLANGQDIMLGELNADDYYNLPNKFFAAPQSNSMFVDRQLDNAVIKLWPTPNQGAFYNGCISVLARRYIQDPGSMSQNMEVPQRWWNALVSRLAVMLRDSIELPPAQSQVEAQERAQLQARLDQAAGKAEALAWGEERSGGPIRWAPDISCYTR